MKKCVIIASCLLVTILAPLVWRADFPESYGTDYSEQMRKLWNDRRKQYPSWTLVDQLPGSQATVNACIFHVGDNLQAAAERRVLRGKQETEIAERIESLNQKEGCNFPWEIQLHPNLSSLPLEGMSRSEIRQLADQGNPDACLVMVWSYFPERKEIKDLTWGECCEVEYWLEKAVGLKRCGARFLLHYYRENRKGSAEVSSGKGSDHSLAEFNQALKDGDYPAYRTLECMTPSESTIPGYEDMVDVLRNRAESGDSKACSRMAQLFFMKHMRYHEDSGFKHFIGSDIHMEVMNAVEHKVFSWRPFIQFLKIPSDFVSRGIMKYKFVSQDDSKTWNRYKEASEYAYKAALQGDLTAMFLWLKCGMTSQNHYSREEWENIFNFHRTLATSGYFPYIKDSYSDWRHTKPNSLSNCIIRSYMSQADLEKQWKACKQSFVFRDEAMKVLEQIKLGDPAVYGPENIKKLIELLSREGKDMEAISYCCDAFCLADSSTRKILMEWGEQCYKDGNVPAIYAFAKIYEQGIGGVVDLKRSWRNLERLIDLADDCPYWIIPYDDGYAIRGMRSHHLPFMNCVKLDLISMALKHSDFPGRSEKMVFDVAQSMAAKLSNLPGGFPVAFALGRVYEKGIGTAPDKNKALHYYEIGMGKVFGKNVVVHEGCLRCWEALNAQDEETNTAAPERPERRQK